VAYHDWWLRGDHRHGVPEYGDTRIKRTMPMRVLFKKGR
jgi:hypothetical protein